MCNIGFATCTLLGTKFGIGKKLLYFLLYHPDYFSKALFVWFFFFLVPSVSLTLFQLLQANHLNKQNSASGWANFSILL